ncbi:MAG: carboxylating nicotinate-nucleotide diphosphorylase [Rhodocyclaceae bacterium]|nr:carboxylating nicotinate-nucleotide diphosphorylase [Rhodocyclaceae bacterium]
MSTTDDQLPLAQLAAAAPGDAVRALAEDIGIGDVTARLVSAGAVARARLVCRDDAVVCGQPWAEAVLAAVDPRLTVAWAVEEGTRVAPGAVIANFEGPAASLLTAERTLLNFLQTLSAIATRTRTFVDATAHTRARIYDTRKTMPGLRMASKYAVRVGGGHNQRIGLGDGALIKENHIRSCGGISQAIKAVYCTAANVPLQVEVTSLDELRQVLEAGARRVLLDNFSTDLLRAAVQQYGAVAELEASGGVNLDTVRCIAETGVHRISVGSLTKDLVATDLSLQFWPWPGLG